MITGFRHGRWKTFHFSHQGTSLDVEGVRSPRRGVDVRLVGATRALRVAARELRERGPIDAKRKVNRGGPLPGGEHRDAVTGGLRG